MICALFCMNVSPKKKKFQNGRKVFPGTMRDSEKGSTPEPALGGGCGGALVLIR